MTSEPSQTEKVPEPESLDSILARDPAGAYATLDDVTRERYRAACREVAAGARRTPEEVAREALRWSEAHDPENPRRRHVGTALLAEGRAALEASLGCRLSSGERLARSVRRHGQGVYVGTLLGLTLLTLGVVEHLLDRGGMAPLARGLLVALLSLSVLDFFEEVVNAVLARRVSPSGPLPRLDPARVFSEDTRTLVVTPLLVTSLEDIEAPLRMLEINYLGNARPELSFILLTDFADAPEQHLPTDAALRERLERGIRELNARHGHAGHPRFFCLWRERRWNPVAGRWMGWERKRGKLDELNRLVLGARDTSYQEPVPASVHAARYVITLDADTHLLPGDAARLVATLHHPLNRARWDASGQRVVAGYSMLQPAIASEPSREAWLASGGWPLSIVREKKRVWRDTDLLSLYQRLFGIGYFLGKGIYDVAAFTRSLEGRIPENTVLSHDKLEGLHARIAYVSDIHLFEGRPASMTSQARVWHRWIRGDWQVLPWLLPTVPSQTGGRLANPLSLIDRWIVLSALRSSLTHPNLLLMLACAWLLLPAGAAGAWTGGLVLWNRRNQLTNSLVSALREARAASSFGRGLRTVVGALPRILIWAVINLIILVPATALVLDAIGRALYGLAFDRSRMLDWTTHAQTSRQVRGPRVLLSLPEVRGGALLSLGLGGVLAGVNPQNLPWAAPFLLGWLATAGFFAHQGRGAASAPARPPEFERMRTLARECWERCARPEPLADTEGRVPSPMDVALGLVAPMSAYHLGYLERGELVTRMEAALTGLEARARHRGHLLVGGESRRVVTAESGVLAAALLVVEGGLSAARGSDTDAGLRERLVEAEARTRTLREALDFGWLYDAEAGLLRTGYDVESRTLDAAHHGLLTSGAMLAGFVAIASKQVPLEHWMALVSEDGRRRTEGPLPETREALAEHLLPTLFVWFAPATLLGQAARHTLETGLGTAVEAAVGTDCSLLAQRFLVERAEAPARPGASAGESLREHAMALAAVANLTCDGILVQHFHQHWQTAWVEGLVYETKDLP